MTRDGPSSLPLRVVEGIYVSGDGFEVSTEALGEDYRTLVAQHPVTVTLPSYLSSNASTPSRLLVAPRWVNQPPRESGRWGFVTSSRGEGPTTVAAAAIVEQFKLIFETEDRDDLCHETAQKMTDSLGIWWKHVGSWIEVMSGQSLTRLGRHQSAYRGGRTQFWSPSDSAVVRNIAVQENQTGSSIGLENRLSFQQLRSCMTLAGSGTDPPLEWLLVRDARSLLLARERRRAVIDAGTAAELAITQMLNSLLEGRADAEKLRKKCTSLGGKSQVVEKLGGHLHPELQARLTNVRNEAAHEGSDPTYEDTCSAVSIAAQIVEEVCPLGALMEHAQRTMNDHWSRDT